jgi:simple sugar transport system permease protein
MDFLAVIFSLQTLDSAVRLSAPLILAALAGLYSERSGIFDIGLEGKMLVGAFSAGCIAAITGSAWLGLVASIVISVLFALVHGYASITQRGNQIVSGVAINFLASGLTAFLGQAWFGEGGKTPQLPASARFMDIPLWGAEELLDIPVIGPFYSGVV